ncbi:MAG: class I SAM-dependent methyltransferase [Pseudomonadota bacterium]|nr:class I SAM-dependent methyltransferase [Pseudomonadota bacterium]
MILAATDNVSAAPSPPNLPTDSIDDEASQSLLEVHRILDAELPSGRLAIYEAGGGSTSYMPPDLLARSDVTVVDIDQHQVARCDYATTKRVGDIQTLRFGAAQFDLVVCFNVIEHLPDVEGALRGFAEALRPGGLLFIGAPNPRSLSGVVTRVAPHWFHVWYYRHVLGDQNAGKPGCAPFPTIFHPLVTPPRLEAFMAALGFDVAYERIYESPRYPDMRRRVPVFAAAIDSAATLMNLALLNRANVRCGDYHIVFRKR